MKTLSKKEVNRLKDEHPDLLIMDGYDDCILGICRRFDQVFVVYSEAAVLRRLIKDGMSRDEAYEFWQFNQLGAWVGEHTPGFVE